MALQREFWIADIQENLFQTNEFLKRSTDDSAYIAFKTVHIPQAGANPTVVADRASFPGTIALRTDADFTYNMVQYSTDPVHVPALDELQISYDKRRSVIGQQNDLLSQTVGNIALHAWAPSGTASRIINTTGASASNALAPTATGTRKAITLVDIASSRSLLDKDNVPSNGRVLIMPSDIYNMQFITIPDVFRMDSYGKSALPSGVVMTIYGYDVYVRPTVLTYDNAGTLKALNGSGNVTSPATTDCLGCLAYHPNFVSSALGAIEVGHSTFQDQPQYYGDIMASILQFGAKYRRADLKGTCAIVQG